MPDIKNGMSERLLVFCLEDERIFEANYFENFNEYPGWRDYQNTSLLEDVTHWAYKPERPERSKREDSLKDEMRCSEHCGNTVREVQ